MTGWEARQCRWGSTRSRAAPVRAARDHQRPPYAKVQPGDAWGARSRGGDGVRLRLERARLRRGAQRLCRKGEEVAQAEARRTLGVKSGPERLKVHGVWFHQLLASWCGHWEVRADARL